MRDLDLKTSFFSKQSKSKESKPKESKPKKKKNKKEAMKPSPASSLYNQETDEQGITAVGMEVDDLDPLDFLSEIERPLVDADFFNSFADDFDDDDIN